MIYDINQELRDFIYLTNIYKFIESYNLIGHQIGRKIGDMLEIITMGVIYRNEELYNRLDTEGKLVGFTTAGHKVEFGFYNNLKKKKGLFGAVECKCVGVEVTKKGKKNNLTLKNNESHVVQFSNRWLDEKVSCTLTFKGIENNDAKFEIKWGEHKRNVILSQNDSIKFALDEHGDLHVVTTGTNMYTEIKPLLRSCIKVQLMNVDQNKAKLSLFNCLAGPQTPEKAKQASLVAMDIRKRIDGHWGKDDIPERDKRIISVLVLTEFSHWEPKSRNMIKTCIDHILVVPDEAIIRAFKLFEEKFGLDEMLDMINKSKFVNSQEVKDAVYEIIDLFEGFILYDIELNTYVEMRYSEGKLVIVPKE